jgi:hypothetical protein
MSGVRLLGLNSEEFARIDLVDQFPVNARLANSTPVVMFTAILQERAQAKIDTDTNFSFNLGSGQGLLPRDAYPDFYVKLLRTPISPK